MSVIVRALRPDEARDFLEVHRASIRGLASRDYDAAVVEAWAPLPITEAMVERLLANAHHEIRLAAIEDGRVVGIGVLKPDNAELRACYVRPENVRAGVGRAVVQALEAIAREHGLERLELDSSLGAEAFYAAMGYAVVRRGEHALSSGHTLACVTMTKAL